MRKLTDLFWFALYTIVARYLPCSYARLGGGFSRWLRYTCCRRLFASCGEHVNVERGVTCGRRVWIGNHSDLGINCQVYGEIHVGNHSFMGPDVVIYTVNHRFDRLDVPMMYQGTSQEKPVVIGDDVWIGARVILLPGVHIGSHSVVGAGAVVTKDVPEWAIVGGNPARVLRSRKGSEIASGRPLREEGAASDIYAAETCSTAMQ